MKIQINEKHIKAVGNVGLKIGKAIIVEGTKAVIMKSAHNAFMTTVDEGFDGLRNMSVDEVLKGKKKKDAKTFEFNLFKRKKKGETEVEAHVESAQGEHIGEIIDIEVEEVDSK